MRIDRGLLGWGLFLVIAGAIPLAVGQGWLPSDIAWWELWPLILVGIGLAILLRRTSWAPLGGLVVAVTFGALVGGALSGAGFPAFSGGCLGGNSGTAFPAQSGSFSGGTASGRLEMGCGDVSVAGASGTDWRIEATWAVSDDPERSMAGGRPPSEVPSMRQSEPAVEATVTSPQAMSRRTDEAPPVSVPVCGANAVPFDPPRQPPENTGKPPPASAPPTMAPNVAAIRRPPSGANEVRRRRMASPIPTRISGHSSHQRMSEGSQPWATASGIAPAMTRKIPQPSIPRSTRMPPLPSSGRDRWQRALPRPPA